MKFKITCRPRYNPWLKNISKLLTVGVLFNSIPFNSFAGTLSPDTRYETFEGNNITIPDVLEEDEVDIEIEGNTLVNLVGKMRNNVQPALTVDSEYIVITDHETNHRQNYYTISGGQLNLIKPNTTYTIIAEITKNTLERNFTLINNYQADGGDITADGVSVPIGFVGRYVGKFTTLSDFTDRNRLGFSAGNGNRGEITLRNNFIILEGDWTNRELPEYFEGMKSVGQDYENGHKIEILSQNNLADIATSGDNANFNIANLKAGKTYTIKSKRSNSSIRYNLLLGEIREYDTFITREQLVMGASDDCYTFTPTKSGILRFNGYSNPLNVSEIMLVEGTYTDSTMPQFKPYVCDKKEILLNKPLIGSEGVKDRIIKKNGQWVIERFWETITLDGTQEIGKGAWDVSIFSYYVPNTEGEPINFPRELMCDKIKPQIFNLDDNTHWALYTGKDSVSSKRYIRIQIPTSIVSPDDLEGFKNWLKANPVTIAYRLNKPIYEPLKTKPTLNTYTDVTHISNNSIIPVNMKVTVDRVLNRAAESIELAKTNPTMENLSRARMWVNLIDDCSLKDQLQDEINNIADIDDLQLERKSASSNLDIYIKSKNMLSMSLNTNSVTFDGYSGTEDMEMLNAVNISINSSLPYSLNAYLPSEIANSDKSEILPVDILNIKEGSETAYQTFNNTTDKIVLKDNCSNGNDLIHNIDLKLSSNLAHKADVYKTVIKFEAEQK